MSPIPRLTLLSTALQLEAKAVTYEAAISQLTDELGQVDRFLFGQLWALVAQLSESVEESAEWVDFLNQEIDQTLADLLPMGVDSNV